MVKKQERIVEAASLRGYCAWQTNTSTLKDHVRSDYFFNFPEYMHDFSENPGRRFSVFF